ncbi:MAG TPA: hypothetical protein DCQ34_03375 [Chitinophagaceae bacterium]|nr:hypothetical protein [Chitinophagaceae bacterium]
MPPVSESGNSYKGQPSNTVTFERGKAFTRKPILSPGRSTRLPDGYVWMLSIETVVTDFSGDGGVY